MPDDQVQQAQFVDPGSVFGVDAQPAQTPETPQGQPQQVSTAASHSAAAEGSTPAPAAPQGADKQDAGQDAKPGDDLQKLQHQNRELQGWSTKVSQENARLREELERRAQTTPTPSPGKDPKESFREMIDQFDSYEDALYYLTQNVVPQMVRQGIDQELGRRESYQVAGERVVSEVRKEFADSFEAVAPKAREVYSEVINSVASALVAIDPRLGEVAVQIAQNPKVIESLTRHSFYAARGKEFPQMLQQAAEQLKQNVTGQPPQAPAPIVGGSGASVGTGNPQGKAQFVAPVSVFGA